MGKWGSGGDHFLRVAGGDGSAGAGRGEMGRINKSNLLNSEFHSIGINGIGGGRNLSLIIYSPWTASAIIKN